MFTKKVNIAIGVPFYRSMDGMAVQSLMTLLADIHNHGDRYTPVFCQNLYIEKARGHITKLIADNLHDKVDYALFLDTDHTFTANHLYALIRSMDRTGLEMLSAAYACRGKPSVYAHMHVSGDGMAGDKIEIGTVQGIVKCSVVGLGFCLFKPALLKRLWDKFGYHLFMGGVKNGIPYTGDDVRFCDLAGQAGIPICFDSDVKIGHISQVVI